MSYKPIESSIKDLLSESYIFNIPRYQRDYVWEDNNIKALVEDIINVAESRASSTHFLGSFVINQTDKENYSVIDGQQRLTTITVIICVLIYLNYKEYIETSNPSKKELVKNNIEFLKSFLYTRTSKGLTARLNTNDDIYLKLIGNLNSIEYGDDHDIINDIDNLVSKNNKNAYVKSYYLIKNLIIEYCRGYNEIVLFQESFLSTNLIKIITNEETEAYKIFEILNARGLTLKQIDLLKNLIFRYISPKEGFDKCKSDWDDMIEKIKDYPDDYLNHFVRMYYGSTIKQEDTYQAIRNTESLKTIDTFYKELLFCASLYRDIVKINTDDYFEYRNYTYFSIKNNKQIRSLLLSLKYKYKKGIISKKGYLDFLVKIEKYFIGFNLEGTSSNRIDRHIIKYSASIYRTNQTSELKKQMEELMAKLYEYYPTKDELKKSFYNIKYSNKNKKGSIKSEVIVFILAPALIGKTIINTKEYNIDHMISDSEEDSLVWQIGNLMPLKCDFHASIKSEKIESKLIRYKESGFYYLKKFYNENKSFNIESIEKNTEKMINMLLDIYYLEQ